MEAGKDTVDTVGLITGENMMVDCGGGQPKTPPQRPQRECLEMMLNKIATSPI